MTLLELEKDFAMLDLDGDDVATIVSGFETEALQVLAGAIRLELIARYQGKPADKTRFH
jgi:hypothetical protein